MTKPYSVLNNRKSEFPIDKIFLERWSPRSLSDENFTEEELLTLIEAARWTPSSSNVQPWRFLYAMHNTSEFKIFLELLGDFNKTWCETAGALLVLISKKFPKTAHHTICIRSALVQRLCLLLYRRA